MSDGNVVPICFCPSRKCYFRRGLLGSDEYFAKRRTAFEVPVDLLYPEDQIRAMYAKEVGLGKAPRLRVAPDLGADVVKVEPPFEASPEDGLRLAACLLNSDACDTFSSPLSSNGTSPPDNQSNSGPGWSFSSATKPSTDTELYMTTLPTGLSSALGCPQISVS